jgi:hypothetical protein
MTTPSSNYVFTKYDLIKMAFALLNKFGADEEVPAESYDLADKMLNLLIKNWMDFGYNLWLKETAFLCVRKGQEYYSLEPSSLDHATLNLLYHDVAITANQGAASITLESVSYIRPGDHIGINLDDLDIFWTYVQNIVGNVVTFTAGILPFQASAGNAVFAYTTDLDIPLTVYEGVREINGIDTPLNSLSYSEYFQLPNKRDQSTPVSYMYDRQLADAMIYLWPVPERSDIIIKLLIGQRINNLQNNSDAAEFPNEWNLPLAYNLAVMLAPAYGKNTGDTFANLAGQAEKSLRTALAFDNEVGSIYIKPAFHR